MNNRRKISRAEIIILAAILAAAVILFIALKFPQNGVNTATINYDGEVFAVSLDKSRVFDLNEMFADAPDMVFEVKNGEIAVKSSDCPGGDCVHSGFIPGGGRVIVCVPNKVTVTVSDENSQFDAVI
jgi:hypothetical protein